MKFFKIITYTVFAAVIVISGIQAQQQKKKTIAVLNFVNSGGVDKDEISILTDRFNNYLVNTNIYKVLEREKMDAILKEQDFTMTDNCNSAECAVQIGQLLGMDLMIAGKIGKFGAVYTLDLRIIDVSTGEIQRTKSENYKGEKEGLLDMVEALAYTIAGLTAPAKKTDTSTGKITSDDTSDEIKIGTVTKTYGSLEIKCEMDGVLYIDDKQIGEVNAGLILPVGELKIGTRKIRIKGNEGEFIKEIRIEENKKAVITAQLEGGKSSGTSKIDDNQKDKVTTETLDIFSTFNDPRDGKTYRTVKIGNQIWMAENLNYEASYGSWCYDNNSANCKRYGRLYDWETAKKAAPTGWHLPSKTEFETLIRNLGSGGVNVYKQIITGGSSNFSALLGGWGFKNGKFDSMGSRALFWSATEYSYRNAWFLDVYGNNQKEYLDYHDKTDAHSVRLIKD